jgi:acetyltransferase
MYDDEKIFPRLLQALIDDANIDVVTVNLETNDPRPKELKSGNRFAAAIEKAAAASNKAIACFSSIVGGPVDPDILLPLRAAGVPIMEGAECATATIRNLAEYYEFQRSGQQSAVIQATPASAPKWPSGILSAEAAFRLFEDFGIRVVPTVLTSSADEAARAAERVGFPVALKIESVDIAHKSDVGGVALRLSSPAEVRQAYARIMSETPRRAPTAKIDGVVVQRMAGEGVEMILGIKRDPLFGPVVICGFGGVLVEVLKDVAVGIPPLSWDQARQLVQRLRGFAILGGARGQPPADLDALCNAIVAVSKLALALGENLVGLDINPLIVYPNAQGAVAVDALVQIR